MVKPKGVHFPSVVSAELFGPIFKVKDINVLRKALYRNNTNRRLALLATFVPNELIFLIEAQKKFHTHPFGVLCLIDIAGLYSMFNEFTNAQNHGSMGFTKIFNLYTSTIIEQICASQGDVLKFTIGEGILSIWKMQDGEPIQKVTCKVISCFFAIKSAIDSFEKNFFEINRAFSKASIKGAISAGSVTFSMIGEGKHLHYVLVGEPMIALRKAIRTSRPSELILAENVWEHCEFTNYDYDIVDKRHIRINQELIKDENTCVAYTTEEPEVEILCKPKIITEKQETDSYSKEEFINTFSNISLTSLSTATIYRENQDDCVAIVQNRGIQRNIIQQRQRLLNRCKIKLGNTIRNFVISSVIEQIEQNKPLEYLTQMKNVSVIILEIIPVECSDMELLSLTNKCHAIVTSRCKHVGCIECVSIRGTSIFFRLVFGIRSYLKDLNHCQFAITCAWKLLSTLKTMPAIAEVSLGISTEMCYVGVIGYVARRHYTVVGPPETRSKNTTYLSPNKVTCDLDTLVYSGIKKKNFFILAKGMEVGKHLSAYYDVRHVQIVDEEMYNVYPILGRFEDLEMFSELLDDIGVESRSYAGVIIQGTYRNGKSRLLDAFEMMAVARQIKVITVVLHPSWALRPYSVIFEILKQILNAEYYNTIFELERKVTKKLCSIINVDELCYLNRSLRVRFKLSKEYMKDSDWDRYRKTLRIFGKILSAKNIKYCILLDNVHFVDYMSWQFITEALNNKNVVLAVTFLGSESWDDLSRVEVDICKDERLKLLDLQGIHVEYLPALACQFLEVSGICAELSNFLMNSGIRNPGWFELFFIIMLQNDALDIKEITSDKAESMNLILPKSLDVTRITPSLFPEETAPILPWNRRYSIKVCLINENFKIANNLTTIDIHGLAEEIFSKLTPFQQDIVKTASVIGKVCSRAMLEKLRPVDQPLKLTLAVEYLMRIRIFDCASMQRRSVKVDDFSFCSKRRRNTFSDMHHLVHCRCHLDHISPEESYIPRYAHCRNLEFKVFLFQEHVYDQLMSEDEKKSCNALAIEIYKKGAKKCSACGGGSFLKIPGKVEKRTTRKTKKSRIKLRSQREAELESAEPLSDKEKSEIEKNLLIYESNRYKYLNSIESPDEKTAPASSHVNKCTLEYPKQSFVVSAKKRFAWRSSKIHPAEFEYLDPAIALEDFQHVDYRHCRCIEIIDCIFMRLQRHMNNYDNNEKIINFNMEYAAALIEFGQPNYALQLLAKADERNDYVTTFQDKANPVLYAKLFKKSLILCLRGDAFLLLGNYPQSKRNYIEALLLFKHHYPTSSIKTCYKTFYERLRENFRWAFSTPTIKTDEKPKIDTLFHQNTAACLCSLSKILLINGHHRAATLASLQSIVVGFWNYDQSSFFNQCKLYISMVKIYSQAGDLEFVNDMQKYIVLVIKQRRRWSNSEEIAMLARVYRSMFKVSLLRGRLERAMDLGIKALRIANAIHMLNLELKILPSLIQVTIRLKRVPQAMDLLHQLRDTAILDVDKSALTWYYALCMDLLLDAGILIESYESCSQYARKILDSEKSEICVLRDSKSLRRLMVGLWSWQLRKGDLSTAFIVDLYYYKDNNFKTTCYSEIITYCKILECQLILITRCINMKKSKQMETLLSDTEGIMKDLDKIMKTSCFIQSHYYLLKAYYYLLHSRKDGVYTYLQKAKKSAKDQKNLMISAWIIANKRTWDAQSYNNMAFYWEENIGYRDTIVWQDVDMFDLTDWSNLLYSLPIPDSHI